MRLISFKHPAQQRRPSGSGCAQALRRWIQGVVVACVTTGSALATVSVDRGAYDGSLPRAWVPHDSWTVQQIRTQWMASLPDGTPLGALSVPGTHNSLSRFNSFFEREWGWSTPDWASYGATQWMDVDRQLRVGVRFLDLRFRHINNELAAHHGEVFQGLRADDVFRSLQGFLQQFPREVVVIRLREEYSPAGNSRSFSDTVEATMRRYPQLFWNGASSRQVPTLGEARGKVVLLQNFAISSSHGRALGLLYPDMAFIQDQWSVPFMASMPSKWRAVKQFAENANQQIDRQDQYFYLNFLSATGITMPPWAVASGQRSRHNGSSVVQVPRDARSIPEPEYPTWCHPWNGQCVDEYIGANYLFLNWVRRQQPNFVGVVLADFPGPALIDAVIQSNQRYAVRRYGQAPLPVLAAAPQASVDVRTGPIFGHVDAQQKCPSVCSGQGRDWNNNWATWIPGQLSVCGCSVRAQSQSVSAQRSFGGSVDIQTGPIRNTLEASSQCPAVCSAAGRRWNSNWTTLVPGQVSVCGCQQ